MRLNTPILSLAALSPLASAQNATRGATSAAPSLVTLDVIETFTTSFTGPQASLGNVTLYVPVPTVVAANATSGLLRFSNATSTAAASASGTPIIIPAGNISYTISAGAAPTSLPFLGAAQHNIVGVGVMLGAAVGVVAIL